MAVWYLDNDDEITDAVARLRGADEERVVFVVPPGSRIASGRINFKLLAREAESSTCLGGGLAVALALGGKIFFPMLPQKVPQRKHLLMRKRYWLYYALTFMSGARRQIFVVFAGFLMVEKFGFSAANIALLFIINHLINTFVAPKIGRVIAHFGERPVLTLEYLGLIIIFTAYAFVEVAWMAATLYVLDHILFAMAIAIRSYFQKIADPADIASTAGVSFTINHIAAVVIPVSFGIVWLFSPSLVFLAGAGMGAVSLLLAQLVPKNPLLI